MNKYKGDIILLLLLFLAGYSIRPNIKFNRVNYMEAKMIITDSDELAILKRANAIVCGKDSIDNKL